MSTCDEVLSRAAEILETEGYDPAGWGLTPPFNIRRAIALAAAEKVGPLARDKVMQAAHRAVFAALGNPLGGIAAWERYERNKQQHDRTQAEAVALLRKSIAEVAA